MKNELAFPGVTYITLNGEKNPEGMTLRDYFAAKALPVCYQYWVNDYFHPDYPDAEDRNAEGRDDFGGHMMDLIAEYAYAMADAMLKAREQ